MSNFGRKVVLYKTRGVGKSFDHGSLLYSLKPKHKDALDTAIKALPKTGLPIPVDLPADSPEELMKHATESGYVVRLDMDDTEESRGK